MEKQIRSILAILSTDIPGYTEKIEEDESQAFRLIAKHRDIINKHVHTSNGLMFKEMGDGTFSKFDSAIDASHCAIKIQSEAIERDLPLRIGIHLGDLLQEGKDFLGSGINIADRIQKLADTGKIYISDDIWRQIKNQPDLNTNELGQHDLKGITGKMTLHELILNLDGTITEKIEYTHKIQVQDEDGKKVEKEAPKDEYLKTITMFFFDNETNNPKLDWLQHGITFACTYGLNQEKLLDIYNPLGHSLIEKSEYENGIGMPNPLKKKISNLSNRNFWFSGKIISYENEYCIITELYDAKKGKLIEQREFIGDDMFKLIDNLSLQLRYDLGIPASHIESTEFLPLSDIYTNSMKAFEYYVKGKVAKLGYDSTASEDYYNKALTADKDFAMVYYTLSDLHHDSESIEKLTESINSAMSRLYKFPESIQYQVKDSYFRYIEKNPDKLLKLNILWTKLNPNSIQAHLQLGYAYYMAGDLDNALKSALVVYNMDMSSFSNLIHIIEIHKRRKNYEEAIMLLTKFCNNYPDNHRSYLALGELYEDMGDFNKAKDQLETASLLEPNNNDIALRLCNLETKFGNFDIAINQLITLDKDPRKTTDEKYEIYRALSFIYKKLGQIKTSIKYVEQMYELGFLWAWTKVEDAGALAWRYIEIGNIKAATIKINELKRKNVESTHGLIAQIFLADIYLFQKEYEKFEECLQTADSGVTQLGFNELIKHRKDRMLGTVCEIKNDYDDAINHYEAALHESPDWHTWEGVPKPRSVGRCYRKLKKYDKSEEQLLDVLKEDPFHPQTHYELGRLYHDMKNTKKAKEHMKIAVDIWKDADPEYAISNKAKDIYQDWQ